MLGNFLPYTSGNWDLGSTANKWLNVWATLLKGAWEPASMTDAAAANGTVYYSTTASKLVFKDSGGTVNNLY